MIDTVYTTVSPYSTKGKNPTTNASDRVYSQQEAGANELTLKGSTSAGYTTSVTIVLPITTTYDASSAAGMGGGLPDGGFPGEGGALPEGGFPGDGAFPRDGAPGGSPP